MFRCGYTTVCAWQVHCNKKEVIHIVQAYAWVVTRYIYFIFMSYNKVHCNLYLFCMVCFYCRNHFIVHYLIVHDWYVSVPRDNLISWDNLVITEHCTSTEIVNSIQGCVYRIVNKYDLAASVCIIYNFLISYDPFS